jgi:hypothetical protein
MAVVKSICARALVTFWYEQTEYKPNQLVELPAPAIASLKAAGLVDDDKAAVAYCKQSAEA